MRRLFWLAIGIGMGATFAFLMARGLRRARQRLPRAIVDEARSLIQSYRQALSEAVEEGRQAMREKEAELRLGAQGSEL